MNYRTAPVKDESPDVELGIEKNKSLPGIRGPRQTVAKQEEARHFFPARDSNSDVLICTDFFRAYYTAFVRFTAEKIR